MIKADQKNVALLEYSNHVNALKKSLLDSIKHGEIDSFRELSLQTLNGGIWDLFKQTVPVSLRKSRGIFFSGHDLSNRLASHVSEKLNRGFKVFDPCCGAGDLLLACSDYIPSAPEVAETIESWNNLILGSDLHTQLIHTTRLRLLLKAFSNCDISSINYDLISKYKSHFNNINKTDFKHAVKHFEEADIITLNPPFNSIKAPEDCDWAGGSIQNAALITLQVFDLAKKGTEIIAILPDVLRSGSRYNKWRNKLASLSNSIHVEIVGRFAQDVDVDVFFLKATVETSKKCSSDWIKNSIELPYNLPCIEDFFNVHVGPVVPHRDQSTGEIRPFVDCKSAPPWELIHELPMRPFDGTLFDPPFLVVRRTSSPSDKYRAKASIIDVGDKVAVENHLIVVQPKDGELVSCYQLIDSLKDKKTNSWLNKRIRCRHLTVSSISKLPLWNF